MKYKKDQKKFIYHQVLNTYPTMIMPCSGPGKHSTKFAQMTSGFPPCPILLISSSRGNPKTILLNTCSTVLCEITEVSISDMKWAYQLEIENKPTIELKSGTEHYFNDKLELVAHKEAVAKRSKLIVTTSDPAVSRKASIAIRSLGKFTILFNGETHRKFFFHLKDGDSFQVGTEKVCSLAKIRD